MMNYLTNLIARNRKEVETIQPRVPSRFEPQTTALHFEKSDFAASEDTETAGTFDQALEVAQLAEVTPAALPSFREPRSTEQDVGPESAPPSFQLEHPTAPAKATVEKTDADARRRPAVAASSQVTQALRPFTQDDRSAEQETSVTVDLSPAAKSPQPPVVEVTKTSASEEVRSVWAQPAAEIRTRNAEKLSLEAPSKSEAEAPHAPSDKKSETTRPVNPPPRETTKPLSRRQAGPAVGHFHVTDREDEGNTPAAIARPILKTAKTKQGGDAAGRERQMYSMPSFESPRGELQLYASSQEEGIEKQTMVRQPLARSAPAEGETLTGVSDVVRRQSPPAREPQMVVPRLLERVRPENPTFHEPVDTSPTINISIGRIEVRATTVPTTAAPKARREHVLSLEQYLKERVSGGGS